MKRTLLVLSILGLLFGFGVETRSVTAAHEVQQLNSTAGKYSAVFARDLYV